MIYLWVDESDKHGSYYSNFYGGILIRSCDLDYVKNTLQKAIDELKIDEEIKWQKVNEYWLERYQKLVDVVFSLMSDGKMKIRIFFRHNQFVPIGLSMDQKREEYQRLYYQFIKHAFGWEYANNGEKDENVSILLDDMPLSGQKNKDFKDVLFGLNKDKSFKTAHLHLKDEDIAEVDSKKHLPLQVMDLILGAMCFRLNDKQKEKAEGKRVRGKRTIAKEKLYKHINMRIREIMPGFNVGISTRIRAKEDVWNHPYRHWSFIPKEHERHGELTKKQKTTPSNLHESATSS